MLLLGTKERMRKDKREGHGARGEKAYEPNSYVSGVVGLLVFLSLVVASHVYIHS